MMQKLSCGVGMRWYWSRKSETE